MTVVGKRTAAAGGTDGTVSSAASLWAVLDALLIAAGWTVLYDYSASLTTWSTGLAVTVGQRTQVSGGRYQCITSGTTAGGPSGVGTAIADGTAVWHYLSAQNSADKVYTSTGESGNDKLFLRIASGSGGTTAEYINVIPYQYFDASTQFGYNPFWGAASFYAAYTYTFGTTINYAFCADKDSFTGMTFDGSARWVLGGGNLKRLPNTSATTTFVSNGAVSAGANATFTFASGNPVTAGYVVGDRVFVVAQQSNVGSPYNQQIPLYATTITALTSTSITVAQANETTTAGALIGADPMPAFTAWNQSSQGDFWNYQGGFLLYTYRPELTNLVSGYGTANYGYIGSLGNTGTGLMKTAPTEVDPDNRTGAVFLSEILSANPLAELSGVIPKWYGVPRTTDAQWVVFRSNKETTNYDYIKHNTTSGQHFACGPFPITGSATVTVRIYRYDADTYVETAELLPVGKDLTFSSPFLSGGEVVVGADTDAILEGALIPSQITDHPPAMTGVLAGELIPQDSGSAPVTSSGSGGANFNPGFN